MTDGTADRSAAVGFVGLGNIGKPMAQRLLDWPAGLWVHDVAAEPVDELVAAGAHAAGSAAELAGNVGLVCVMVRDDEQALEVVGGLLEGARPGLAVAVHSTISPQTATTLADLAARRGVLLVDAPVSGGPMGAAAGSLAILVGGSEEAFSAAAPVLARMGEKVVHAGDIGAGTRMKLARNLVHFVAFAAVTEAQRVAEAAGLDLVALGDVVRHTDAITGGPGAIMHRDSTAPLAPDDFWYGVFDHVAALGEKDLDLATRLAHELDVAVPLAELARTRLAAGLGLPEEGAHR